MIEVVPHYVHPDGTPLTPDELAFVIDPATADPGLADPTAVGALDAAGAPPSSVAAVVPGSTASTSVTASSAGRTAATPAPTAARHLADNRRSAHARHPRPAPAPISVCAVANRGTDHDPAHHGSTPNARPTTAPATTPPPRTQASG